MNGKEVFPVEGGRDKENTPEEECIDLCIDPVPTGSPQHYKYSEKGYCVISPDDP